MSTKPNLFEFATSELSQDAFIAWLLSWAKPEFSTVNPELHAAGCDFLKSLVGKSGIQLPEQINKIEVQQQKNFIDVLVVINGNFAIVIEDKVHMVAGQEQISRYRKWVNEEFNIPLDSIACVLVKTGDQSAYLGFEDKRYRVFLRKEWLELLQRHSGKVKSDIFLDFHRRLKKREHEVNAYLTKAPAEWNDDCWAGFFSDLQKRLNVGEWKYNNNPGGKYYGFHWHWRGSRYLQIDGKTPSVLGFRIHVKHKSEQATERNAWHQTLMSVSMSDVEFPISKPARFGSGSGMISAVAKQPFQKTGPDGLIDMDHTVAYLRLAEQLLDQAAAISPELVEPSRT